MIKKSKKKVITYAENKAEENENLKVEPETMGKEQDFFFPELGLVVRAVSLKEAMKKLKELTKN